MFNIYLFITKCLRFIAPKVHRTVHTHTAHSAQANVSFSVLCQFLAFIDSKKTQKCDGFWHFSLFTVHTGTLLLNVLSIVGFFFFFFCRLRSSPLLVCLKTGNYYIMTLIAQPARILNKQSIGGMGNILREKLKLKTTGYRGIRL